MTKGEQIDTGAARVRLADALLRTAGGDRAAFMTLYGLTSAKLFGICLRICGERKTAEDVLQEVYLSIWRRAGGFDPARGSAISWLATIARNRAIDWRRAQRPGAGNDAELPELADDRPDAQQRMLLDEREQRLHLCLDDLEPRQRGAIRDAFFGGSTYAELAIRRDVPLGTVKSWVRRGLMRLKDCLNDDG